MLTSKQLLTINSDLSKENGQLYFLMLKNKCPPPTYVSIPDFYGIVLEIIISVIIILSSDYYTYKGSQLFLWTEKTRDILVP